MTGLRPESRGGVQELSTGVVGGFFGLLLISALGFYQAGPHAGPIIPQAFGWMPPDYRFQNVNRDYFDIMACVFVIFECMVVWEHARARRPAILVTIGLGLLGLGGLAAGWNPSVSTPLGWTAFEVGTALLSGALLGLWLPTGWSWARQSGPRPALTWVLRTSFWRWAAGVLAFNLLLAVVFSHPYFAGEGSMNWRLTCVLAHNLYFFLGFPYAVASNLRGANLSQNVRDPGFMLLLMLRALRVGAPLAHWRVILGNRRMQTALGDLAVKLFFVPLMVGFLFGNCGTLLRNLPIHGWRGFDHAYDLGLAAIYVMDVSLGLIGYVCASRWLGNKTVSVEPTLAGWAVALACYPPFNQVTGALLPTIQPAGGPGSATEALLKVAGLTLMAIYVWATMAFGLRFSNLTHRGLVAVGPYRFVRHPAYITKNLFWWTECLRSSATGWNALALLGWNIIYGLRALTEERHLSEFDDYRGYCRQVRYRFIPGLL